MSEKIVMPKLGATMEEGTIDAWLVEVGDVVEEGDPIVEIQTDKITMEIEAETSGILLKKIFDAGETVPVQEIIAYIGEEENIDEIINEGIESKSILKAKSTEEIQTDAIEEVVIKEVSQKQNVTGSIRRTPIARRIAAEQNVSLNDIKGTGPLGRIQKKDVENHLLDFKKKITPLARKVAEENNLSIDQLSGTGVHGKIVREDVLTHVQTNMDLVNESEKRIEFKGMRKVIAKRISDSFYAAPHVTLHSEIDMTECVKLRKQLLPIIEDIEGVRVSYNEIIIKATGVALKRNPSINISLEKESEIVCHSNIHIGFAVAVPAGLVVPVLRNVDQKGLGALTKEAKVITKQARDGILSPDNMQGSTFTISNLGMYAVDGFTPIINQPNAAILGVGRIKEKPVAVSGVVEVRSMMSISLSFDHRIVDGAPAAQFLTDLKNVLEQPYQLMV